VRVEKVKELLPIPARHDVLPVDNKGRIFTKTIPDGFVNARQGFGVNEPDPNAVLIKAGKFANPIRELVEFLSQVFRIFGEGFLIDLVCETALIKDEIASATVTEHGE
jgi:hypothetical protein